MVVAAFKQEGPSRGLLCDCATSPINRFAALPATIKGGDRGRAHAAHRANIVLQVVDAGESPPCWTP